MPSVGGRKLLVLVGVFTAVWTSNGDAQSFSEIAGDESGCGTKLSPGDVPIVRDLIENGFYDTDVQQMEGSFHAIAVAIHVVRRTNGSGGVSLNTIATGLDRANNDIYIPFGIVLVPAYTVDYINNDNFYENIDTRQEMDALRMTNSIPHALNVYYVNALADSATQLCGTSSFTFSPVQGIVMSNSCAADGSLTHEVGHYFDLFHTFETMFGTECADSSNCSTAGDLVCDTPATPGGGTNASCEFNPALVDSCNGDPFHPDTHNYMDYLVDACYTRLSSGQQQRAFAAMLNGRADHIMTTAICARPVYVDPNAGGGGNGSWQNPFRTIAAAHAAQDCTGGLVYLLPGSYHESPIVLTNRMQFISRGAALID